jgi:hypothetical protein
MVGLMIRARLNNGHFVMGIDAENVRRLKDGKPILIDLKAMGGTDVVVLMYGNTMSDIVRELEKANGAPLPPVQPLYTNETPQ